MLWTRVFWRSWGVAILGVAPLALSAAGCTGDIVKGEAPGHGPHVPAHSDPGSTDDDPSNPSATHGNAGNGEGEGGDDKPSTNKPGDDPTETPIVCTDLGSIGAPVPLRRLTATQVQRSVADVLGVDQALGVTDERLFKYRSNVSAPLDSAGARGYLDFAEAAVAQADLARCATESCLDWLLDEIGLRMFRRPLSDEQRARFSDLHELGAEEGPRWVLEAMLQSPSFLYLDETVDDDGYLDDYSLASRMALVLWGSNPDATLLARAADGKLSTTADIREEAKRMLADPRSGEGLRDFVDQWLELEKLDDADSRPDIAALGPETIDALREEPVALFASLLQQGKGLRDVLTTTETPRIDALMPVYGDDIVSSTSDTFSLDPLHRAGILSLPGVMAALAHAGVTSPTRRGYAVLASLLCDPPDPPPPGVKATLPEVGPNASARERLEAHFSDDVCGSCHRQMDGIGFAFEGIDWLGQSRADDHGNAIDDATTFELEGEQVDVKGIAELTTALAQSDQVAQCVARQWARYATGIPENDDAKCLIQQLGRDLPDDGGLADMMITYLTSDWFRRGGEL